MPVDLCTVTDKCCCCCERSAVACHETLIGILIIWFVLRSCDGSGSGPAPTCDMPHSTKVTSDIAEGAGEMPHGMERV